MSMGYWSRLARAIKGTGADGRPPLTRLAIGPWSAPVALPDGDALGGYTDQVRAGYCDNPIAQRAVRIIAEGVGAAPLNASDPALAGLVAATSAGQGLLETVAAQLLLHGNAYVQLLRGADGRPCELYALRPERVSIIADPRGWPSAFDYHAGEQTIRIPAEEGDGAPALVHIRGFHPLDDHYGLGCLGAAAPAIALHNAANRWNRALIDNAARPSGALVYDPGEPGAVLSPEQFDRLQDEMIASFTGAAQAGRPLLLEGGLRWQAMGLTPADMDFVALKAAAARDIALAFGVPPMLLGLPGDSTYANYREANRALWRLTLLPLADKIVAALAEALAFWWHDAALAVDRDRVPALAEDRERLWAQVSAADFLSPAEKRAMLNLGDMP